MCATQLIINISNTVSSTSEIHIIFRTWERSWKLKNCTLKTQHWFHCTLLQENSFNSRRFAFLRCIRLEVRSSSREPYYSASMVLDKKKIPTLDSVGRREKRATNSKMRELCYASTELGRSTLQQVFFPHLFFAVEHFQSLTSYAFRLRLDVCSDDDDEHTIWRSKPSALFQYRISARRLWVSLRFPPLVSTVAVYIISFVSLSLLLAGVRLIGIINYKIIIVSVLWLPRNVWSSFFLLLDCAEQLCCVRGERTFSGRKDKQRKVSELHIDVFREEELSKHTTRNRKLRWVSIN